MSSDPEGIAKLAKKRRFCWRRRYHSTWTKFKPHYFLVQGTGNFQKSVL